MIVVGGVLVACHGSFSKRVTKARQRLGLDIGIESHPVMLLVIGLIFMLISVAILAGTLTDAP
ncbi:hypothetical protein ASF17_11125 [Frigoribacterium sp. Leaf263]|nr:hypothetical protein ASF17_11125 [Frigoribacterium sp. Leaf263]